MNADPQWIVGGSHLVKRIHRPGCRYEGLGVYAALDGLSVQGIVRHLDHETEFGNPLSWHRGCLVCARDLDEAIAAARGEEKQ